MQAGGVDAGSDVIRRRYSAKGTYVLTYGTVWSPVKSRKALPLVDPLNSGIRCLSGTGVLDWARPSITSP